MQINIGKTDGAVVDVDVDSLTASVMQYIIKYGLTQILNDAHSQVTSTSEPDREKRKAEAWALANKKLDALKRGELRSVSGPRAAKDPVKAIALEMAANVLTTRVGDKQVPLASLTTAQRAKLDKSKVRAALEDYLVRNPAVVEKARARHEETLAMADAHGDEIDIDALMGDAAE